MGSFEITITREAFTRHLRGWQNNSLDGWQQQRANLRRAPPPSPQGYKETSISSIRGLLQKTTISEDRL
ncbi:hypothetical protein CDAR_6371 [Caerostris darwini]|uniref:Uncharacterized protein n=1 Tax=Caerostris darwini TaxID=1538125 RepID=A0AAV4S1N3_9ARAC|nr:hypothetical protein CDAR_6371 [Caerostris darwini]